MAKTEVIEAEVYGSSVTELHRYVLYVAGCNQWEFFSDYDTPHEARRKGEDLERPCRIVHIHIPAMEY